jgi:hypothetical protein
MSCDPGTASSTIEKNRIGQEEGAVLQFFFTVQWKSFGASARSDVLLIVNDSPGQPRGGIPTIPDRSPIHVVGLYSGGFDIKPA